MPSDYRTRTQLFARDDRVRRALRREDPVRTARAVAAKPLDLGSELRYGPLADWIGFNLRMAQEASFMTFARQARSVTGTRPGRFAVLTLIDENPGISQTALGLAAGRDKSTLTPVLNDLVRRGWVRRQRNRVDRRTYLLTLTPTGKARLRQLTACARRHERSLDRIIGAGERARFLSILRRIAAEIE